MWWIDTVVRDREKNCTQNLLRAVDAVPEECEQQAWGGRSEQEGTGDERRWENGKA